MKGRMASEVSWQQLARDVLDRKIGQACGIEAKAQRVRKKDKVTIHPQQRGRGTNELDVIALQIERAGHAF